MGGEGGGSSGADKLALRRAYKTVKLQPCCQAKTNDSGPGLTTSTPLETLACHAPTDVFGPGNADDRDSGPRNELINNLKRPGAWSAPNKS